MANGRRVISRRGHNAGPYPGQGTGRRQEATARNTLPRKSSPEGIDARLQQRIAARPKLQPPGARPDQYTYHLPGSRNPRKAGR